MINKDRPDLEHVLRTATVLVNTGPPAVAEDEMADLASLQRFVEDRVITEVEPPSAPEVEAVRRVRTQLRSVFAAPDDASRLEIINGLLAAAHVSPRVTDHDGLGPHLHFSPPFSSVADHLLADCAMALAEVLVLGEGERLRVCHAPDCGRVLVDNSRNRSRIFCDSGRCGNRVNAAAYRARQRRIEAADNGANTI
jgi:predicted RNA-binding Zn ribbon-like protein